MVRQLPGIGRSVGLRQLQVLLGAGSIFRTINLLLAFLHIHIISIKYLAENVVSQKVALRYHAITELVFITRYVCEPFCKHVGMDFIILNG